MRKLIGIYSITNKVSKKVYVGQASDIWQRWRQHRHRLARGTHDNRHLQAAWVRHGADAFLFTVVKECGIADLGMEEIAMLATVPDDMRYNLVAGGDNPMLGVKKSREAKINKSYASGGRPFFRRNIATGEVQRFEYTPDAASDMATRGAINKILSGFRKKNTHRGFEYWADTSFVPPAPPPPKMVDRRNREVIGTSIATGVEQRFAYVALVEVAGFSRTGAVKCLAGEMATSGGHRWRYADGLPHKSMAAIDRAKLVVGARARQGSRSITGVHMVTGDVVRFAYVKAAADAIGVTAPAIHHALSGKAPSAGGYTWIYDVQ